MDIDTSSRLDAVEAAIRFIATVARPEHPSDPFTAQAANQLRTANPNAAALLGPLLDWAVAVPGS